MHLNALSSSILLFSSLAIGHCAPFSSSNEGRGEPSGTASIAGGHYRRHHHHHKDDYYKDDYYKDDYYKDDYYKDDYYDDSYYKGDRYYKDDYHYGKKDYYGHHGKKHYYSRSLNDNQLVQPEAELAHHRRHNHHYGYRHHYYYDDPYYRHHYHRYPYHRHHHHHGGHWNGWDDNQNFNDVNVVVANAEDKPQTGGPMVSNTGHSGQEQQK